MQRLFLIDSNCYIYRAFHAIPGLKTSSGFPTNAIYGFTTMLMKLCREQKPDYVGSSFDLPFATYRHKMFPGYKANRPPMPDELEKQIPVIKDIVSAMQIPILEKEGFEADDVIATVAKRAEESGLEVYILSKDKDCLQMVTSQIKVIKDEEGVVYDTERIRKLYGVSPPQLADVMALTGDTSDNVRGIPGIGMKTATSLVSEFGSVENLLENTEKVTKPSLRENLRNSSETVKLNKKLLSANYDVPVQFELESLKAKDLDRSKLAAIFEKLEFKKLLEML